MIMFNVLAEKTKFSKVVLITRFVMKMTKMMKMMRKI